MVFNLPPDKIVTVHGEEEKPVLLDMRGRLEDTNEVISAVSVTVKDEDGAGVSGGMFVFRDALVQAAKTAGMLVDLTDLAFLSLDAEGLAARASDAKEDPHQYHGAISRTEPLRRVFRDLTAADIAILKASATDLTEETSDIDDGSITYTVKDEHLAALDSSVDRDNGNLIFLECCLFHRIMLRGH